MKAVSQASDSADTYQFRFKDPRCLWANFTVNNSTGEFSIQSDAGSWSHRWNIGSLWEQDKQNGKPLAHFLGVTAGAGYILDKLGYGQPRDLANIIDKEGTISGIRQKILENRREQDITKEQAKSGWDEAKEWMDQYNFAEGGTGEAAIDAIYSGQYETLKDLFDLWGCYIHDFLEYKKSHTHNFLMDELIPFFQNHLRVEVLGLQPKGST